MIKDIGCFGCLEAGVDVLHSDYFISLRDIEYENIKPMMRAYKDFMG